MGGFAIRELRRVFVHSTPVAQEKSVECLIVRRGRACECIGCNVSRYPLFCLLVHSRLSSKTAVVACSGTYLAYIHRDTVTQNTCYANSPGQTPPKLRPTHQMPLSHHRCGKRHRTIPMRAIAPSRRFIQGRTASRAPDSSHIYIWVPPRPAVPTCYPCVAHPHAAPKSCALLGYERAGVKNGALFSRVPSPADPNPGSSRTLLASADRTWARIRQVSGTPEVIPSWRARESRGWF